MYILFFRDRMCQSACGCVEGSGSVVEKRCHLANLYVTVRNVSGQGFVFVCTVYSMPVLLLMCVLLRSIMYISYSTV